MRIKLDENLPVEAAVVLRPLGHDVDTVADEAMAGAADEDVLRAATGEGRLLITLDRGFGDIRRHPPGTHAGVIVLVTSSLRRSLRRCVISCSPILSRTWLAASRSSGAVSSASAAPDAGSSCRLAGRRDSTPADLQARSRSGEPSKIPSAVARLARMSTAVAAIQSHELRRPTAAGPS